MSTCNYLACEKPVEKGGAETMSGTSQRPDACKKAARNIANVGMWLIKHADDLSDDLVREAVLEDGFTITASIRTDSVPAVKVTKEYSAL